MQKQLIGQGAYGRIYKGEYQLQEVLTVLQDIDEEREAKEKLAFLANWFILILFTLRVSPFKAVLCLNIWHLILKSEGNCSIHSLNELINQLKKSKFIGYENIIVEIAEDVFNSVSFLHSTG